MSKELLFLAAFMSNQRQPMMRYCYLLDRGGLLSPGTVRLFSLNPEQGLLDLLSLADRTSAGFLEALALSEDEAAFQAFRRACREVPACVVRRTFDMLQVAIHVLFRNMDLTGDFLCGKGLILEEFEDLAPDRLMPFNRHERFFWLLPLHHVFLWMRA